MPSLPVWFAHGTTNGKIIDSHAQKHKRIIMNHKPRTDGNFKIPMSNHEKPPTTEAYNSCPLCYPRLGLTSSPLPCCHFCTEISPPWPVHVELRREMAVERLGQSGCSITSHRCPRNRPKTSRAANRTQVAEKAKS